MIDVCVIGSANIDLVAAARRLPEPGETVLGTAFAEHPGGKGLNQVIAAARAGARTAFVGCVGGDHAGRSLLAELATAGVDAALVSVLDEHPTGRALIVVDQRGENTVVVVPGANSQLVVDALPAARVVLVQLEISLAAVASALRVARDQGALTVLNPAPSIDLPPDLLALVDVVVPNVHEAARLGGPATLLRAGAGAVVTTLGGDGVEVVTAERRWRQPAVEVATVDTTGAGDAFCGALAARLADGVDLADAVRVAAAAGALATTRFGAVRSMPGRREIDALLADLSVAPAAPPSPRA